MNIKLKDFMDIDDVSFEENSVFQELVKASIIEENDYTNTQGGQKMKVRVMYAQEFNGEVITDEYIKTIDGEYQIPQIKYDLYSDPNVIDVEVDILED